ncbi:hypothetical protein DICA4_F34354 [Diutina catenulata]
MSEYSKTLIFINAADPVYFTYESYESMFELVRYSHPQVISQMIEAVYLDGLKTWDGRPYAPYYYCFNYKEGGIELHSSTLPYSKCTILDKTLNFESAEQADRLIEGFPWTKYDDELYFDAPDSFIPANAYLTLPEFLKLYGVK